MNKSLVILGVIVAAGVGAYFWWWQPWQEETALDLAGVVESQEVRLGSKIGGRVEQVEVAEGQTVQTDQILVRFAMPERLAQREQARARLLAAEAVLERARNGPRAEEILAAEAVVAAAQARLSRLQKGWREEEIRQAQSERDAAEADLNLAKEDFERVERLARLGGGAVSRTDQDVARAALDRARGRFAAAKARLDMLQAGSRAEDIAEAESELKRAEANLLGLRNGSRPEDIKLAEAQHLEARAKLQEIEADLDEGFVRAPSPAFVEVVAVRRGDLVMPHQPIVRILRTDDVWIKVFVPEPRLGQVQKGQTALVTVESHPGRQFKGRVSHVAAISEFLPRNVQSPDERRNQVFGVKVTLEESEAAAIFKPGMSVRVELPLHR
ncbi:MAG TPA: efflux RND transporter periplasmic adaptor subunit [Gemmatales bacterium]|nr:efflux RND transporter periplasmic adaptor subunit [Gemmatales bacterium]